MVEIVWRNVWCNNIKPQEMKSKIPQPYREGKDGESRQQGMYGGGFGGELLICLLPEDDGKWFLKFVCDNPTGSCRHLPEEVRRTEEGLLHHNEV